MNERIKELAEQASFRQFFMPKSNSASALDKFNGTFTEQEAIEKFAELIVRECNQAVSEVPLFYQDYRSQIEAAVIRDCARAVLARFGVE